MKRILVLTWTSFNKWSLKRLGLDVFKKPNYKVIVYDVSNILFKRFNKINSQHYRKDNLKIFNFYNKKKLVKELKKNNYDIVINLTNLNDSNSIYKEILKKKIKIVHFTDHKLINDIFFPKIIYIYLKFFFKKISSFFVKKNQFEICFLGGNNIFNKLEAIGKKIIYSHSINYDLTLRNKGIIKKRKKIVSFIDSGYGLHPDFKLSVGINKKFDLKNYSLKINLLFKILKKMNYDVFFLANPKIPLIKQKIYKNCKIIYEKPLEHIRGSDLVVFTDSSVIEFAITYKKKILNLFSKEIKSYPINYKASKTFYKFFKHQPLNLDKLKSENQILDKIMYPNRKYQLYEEMFIKSANTKKITYASLIKNLLKK